MNYFFIPFFKWRASTNSIHFGSLLSSVLKRLRIANISAQKKNVLSEKQAWLSAFWNNLMTSLMLLYNFHPDWGQNHRKDFLY